MAEMLGNEGREVESRIARGALALFSKHHCLKVEWLITVRPQEETELDTLAVGNRYKRLVASATLVVEP